MRFDIYFSTQRSLWILNCIHSYVLVGAAFDLAVLVRNLSPETALIQQLNYRSLQPRK